MTAKTDAERKRKEREQLRKDGYRPLSVWVHADDYARLRDLCERANLKRLAKR